MGGTAGPGDSPIHERLTRTATTMYVLSYNYSTCDEHDFEVIAASESTHALEVEIERLMGPVRDYQQQVEAIDSASEAYYAKCQKQVREWLLENVDCVREIRPRLYNGEFYVKDFHTMNNTPYHPSVKQRELEKAIDVIVTTHWMIFLDNPGDDMLSRQDEFVNKELLKSPVPVLEREDHPYPNMKKCFTHYHQDGFKIQEIKII
jgi:hypothetical protein